MAEVAGALVVPPVVDLPGSGIRVRVSLIAIDVAGVGVAVGVEDVRRAAVAVVVDAVAADLGDPGAPQRVGVVAVALALRIAVYTGASIRPWGCLDLPW